MKMSQWRRAVKNTCVFSARLKAVFDRSSDSGAGGRRFHAISQFQWNSVLLLGLSVRRTDWLSVVILSQSSSLFHFLTIVEQGILDLLAFLIQLRADFHDTWRNDCRRQGNEPTTFWEQSGRHHLNRD